MKETIIYYNEWDRYIYILSKKLLQKVILLNLFTYNYKANISNKYLVFCRIEKKMLHCLCGITELTSLLTQFIYSFAYNKKKKPKNKNLILK